MYPDYHFKGGTADITVHEKKTDGSLKELTSAAGGACGGINVDHAFMKVMEQIVGSDILKTLKYESMEDYIELVREFETKKRAVVPDKDGKTRVLVPLSLVNYLKKKNKNGFPEALKQTKFAETITFSKQKLLFINDVFRDLFEPTINNIVTIMRYSQAEELRKRENHFNGWWIFRL